MKAERATLLNSLVITFLLVLVMWMVKLTEVLFDMSFVTWGLYPRSFSGLSGIITAPFIHKDFLHLISNSFPLLVLGTILLTSYKRVALKATLWIFLLTGLWVWTAARPAYHIGASGIVYGLVSFLFFMGLLRRDPRSMALALLVTFLYGGLIWGIFPLEWTISWESHLLGGIAGIFAAVLYYKVDLPPKPVLEDPVDNPEMPYWKYEVEGELKPEENQPAPTVIRYIFKPEEPESQQENSGS